jgi:hypothetical protein
MTPFLRLLDVAVDKKADVLLKTTQLGGARLFEVDPSAFIEVPGSPFSYWVSNKVRHTFVELDVLQSHGRISASGGKTLDDSRFIRASWEVTGRDPNEWPGLAKGGAYSPFYADVFLKLYWVNDARVLKCYLVDYRSSRGWSPNWTAELHGSEHYLRPGLTWPRRTQSGLGMRAMPAGCIFADKGPAAFVVGDAPSDLLALLSIVTSSSFRYLVELQMAFGSYEVGVIQRTPVPNFNADDSGAMARLARRAWSLKRTLDTVNETSHAFLLPAALRVRLGSYDPSAIEAELVQIQRAIDDLAFQAYDLQGEDRTAVETWASKKTPVLTEVGDSSLAEEEQNEDGGDVVDAVNPADTTTTLHSWAVGAAFGRFDLRLATGERQAPHEPEPFDPLPTRSPGMVPETDTAQVIVRAVLVDDPGHLSDLTAQAGGVLERVGFAPENPEILRRWLSREFFPLHIKMYSKSRRKAPIYWQLATLSASYSAWLYIHAFTSDTLYKIQELIETKLWHEETKLDSLRNDLGLSPEAAGRKALSAQEIFVEELRTFLDEVKRVAPLWSPDLDDGVIINFAPLWRLVPHHKPWQKELKATWDALCAGEYDWAHLAMHLWPERVVPKCASDRSLAIAHGVEDVFWLEGQDGKWKPRPTPARPVEELVRERTSPAVKTALKSLLEAPTATSAGGRGWAAGRKRKASGGAT